MDNDDLPVGRILSRRDALTLFSVAGATMFTPWRAFASNPLSGQASGTSLPGCLARPELVEGPYFVDAQLNRSDIRSDPSTGAVKPGVPLTLAFNVVAISGGTCSPLPGAMVDVWQCDAVGNYSGFQDRSAGFDTRAQAFLRGHQVTDESGLARFTTIYPGWYRGRAVHVHFKIRTNQAPGQAYEFTSQLFFDESLTDRIHAESPYAANGRRDTLNQTDQIFRSGGDQLMLSLAPRGDGFESTFGLGLDLTDARTGGPDGGQGRGGGRGRGRGPGRG